MSRERSPLLERSKAKRPLHSSAASYHSINGSKISLPDDLDSDLSDDSPPTWQHESKTLGRYAIQIYFTTLLEGSSFTVTVICLGHLGTKQLAASSIAGMTSAIFAMSIIQGFAAGLDTLCPQAYTSAPKTTSLHAMRTACILFLLMIPQVLVFWNSEFILLHLKQDAEVAYLAALYLKTISFALPGIIIFECTRRWLQAQGLVHVPTIAAGVVFPLNIALNYLTVWSTGPFALGFIGAPLSVSISCTIMAAIGLGYSYLYAPRDAWGGFTPEIFRNWHHNWTFGLAGCAMTAAEWISWEIVTFLVSMLGPAPLAAQAVLANTQWLFYMPAMSIAIASSVRTGNLLGADKADKAKYSAKITMIIGSIIATLACFFVWLNQNWIGKLFTREPEVLMYVEQVIPLLAIWQIVDSVSGTAFGIMRGTGKNALAAAITGAAYYGIGIPLGALLTFGKANLGLYGTWLGLVSALFFTSVGLTVYIFCYLDFDKAAEAAMARSVEHATEAAEQHS